MWRERGAARGDSPASTTNGQIKFFPIISNQHTTVQNKVASQILPFHGSLPNLLQAHNFHDMRAIIH